MQLGMVGLGRMGGNMTLRCLASEHQMVVYDQHPGTVESYVAQGATGATSIADLIHQRPWQRTLIYPPTPDLLRTLAKVAGRFKRRLKRLSRPMFSRPRSTPGFARARNIPMRKSCSQPCGTNSVAM
jgi:6-phosphogluconate dehydrogenase